MQGALRSAVESIQPGDSRANFGELAHGVRALAETVHTPIELHLFSDMQKTGMPANFTDMALPPNVSVVLHPVGDLRHPELDGRNRHCPGSASRSQRSEEISRAGGDCRLWNSGRIENRFARGQRQDNRHPKSGRSAGWPGNGRVPPLDVPFGLNRCAIRIDSADGFPADDVSVFAVKTV